MAEAQNGCATLQDVDGDTFVRFIEWAHKGYYTAAEFTTVVQDGSDSAGPCTEDEPVAEKPFTRTIIPDEEDDGQSSPDEEFSFLQNETSTFGQAFEEIFGGDVEQYKSKMSELQERVLFPVPPNPVTARIGPMRSFVPRRPFKRRNAIKIPSPRRNQSSAEVYSDVFLSHARLYVFAEKYDIQALKMLALGELYATLAVYNLYNTRTSDIIDLLRYVYCNTYEPSESAEDMRTLMTQYVGYEMDTLSRDEDFRDLMIEDGGALLSDFLTTVRKRISQEKNLPGKESLRERISQAGETFDDPPFL